MAAPLKSQTISFRWPNATDGPEVNALIAECKPLDPNSLYCNLLQCSHFSGTCVIAEQANNIVGFVSAYLRPDEPNTLFIWQIAVAEGLRGQRLGRKLLENLLSRPSCRFVDTVETTITENNRASWRLFESFAKDNYVKIETRPLFKKDIHFSNKHDTEICVRLSPFVLTDRIYPVA